MLVLTYMLSFHTKQWVAQKTLQCPMLWSHILREKEEHRSKRICIQFTQIIFTWSWKRNVIERTGGGLEWGGWIGGGVNQNTLYACMKFSNTHTQNWVHLRSCSFSSTRSDVMKRFVFRNCGGELRPLLKLKRVSDKPIHLGNGLMKKKLNECFVF